MITFNGIDLEGVAPVMIEDIRVSPIELQPMARQRPIHFGADYVRMGGGSRTVAITFALLTMNRDERANQLTSITRWARSAEPAPLTLSTYHEKYLPCVCTSLPEPSTRQWWEAKLRLVFTAYDPYWVSTGENSVACGTQFSVVGDAPPLMQIRRTLTSAATNQTYSNGSESMTFSNVPAGNLVIDLNKQTAAVGNTSIMQYFPLTGSKFLTPKTGVQTITGNGTVYWRARWN